MQKKRWIWVLFAVLMLAGLILGGLWGRNWYWEHNVVYGDVTYDRDIGSLKLEPGQTLDVEGLQEFTNLQELDVTELEITVEEYERLSTALPGCEISWLIPFQGQYLDPNTESVTVEHLTQEDVDVLSCFTNLKAVNAESCTDYEQINQLRQKYAQVDVAYGFRIGEDFYPSDVQELTLENADGAELKSLLPYMEKLTDVSFTGETPANDSIYEMMELRQDVVFHWNFYVCGVETSSTAEELFLNDIPMESTAEVETALKYFYDLKWVEMCNCGISSEEMDGLSQRNPDTRFVWTIQIRDSWVRTDIKALIPYKLGYYMSNRLTDDECRDLKYCVDIECLDMGHMNISDYSFLNYMPKMKYLVLADTIGTDFSALANLKELVYLEVFYSKFSQPEVLLDLPKLEDLNIGFTDGGNVEVLKQLTGLKRLWLPKTGLTRQEYDELCDALPDTQVVMYVKESTAGNWRDNDNYRAMRDMLGMGYMK